MKTEFVNFDSFWLLLQNRSFYQRSQTAIYSQVVGFHVYAELKLNLSLSAADEPVKASKCVSLLEDFTQISDRCAALVGARILEVQGERIHFVLPAPLPNAKLADLLRFASALTRMAYANLKPAAGDDWGGFVMAADHGPAVLVPSSFGGGSLVSLGNAANQPAKKLGRGVESGHLALPQPIGRLVPGAKPSGNWVEIDVKQPTADTRGFFNEQLSEAMGSVARQVLTNRQQRAGVEFANAVFEGISFAQTPLRTQGMCLRADLEGFTKAVEAAFAQNTVPALVQQFTDLMQYPVDFLGRLGRQHVELPWAGDCCTLLIQPGASELIEEMRAVLPIEAGRLWHGLALENGTAKRWSRSMGEAKWAVGFACGDADEGGNGSAIVAEFSAAGRSFRVLVGWCGRRARDAQECSGVGGDDVALPESDFQNLEEVFKPIFTRLSSTFRKTSYDRIKRLGHSAGSDLAVSAPAILTGVSTALPAPRPYGRGN